MAKLKDLVDPNRTIRYGIVQPGKYDSSGRYMIRGQDYSKGWADSSELFRVSPAIEEPFANARVKKGDILITIVGASTGRIAVVPEWLDGANLTQTTARIALQPKLADESYCSHVLRSSIGLKQVANYIKGAAQPGLNCGDIEKFVIPLPPLTEQKAIGGALSDVEELLDSLDQLIHKKYDLKMAAMQQLLTGQIRLPEFNEEWSVKSFSDVLIRVNAKPYQIQASDYKTFGDYAVVDQGKDLVAGFSDLHSKCLHCPDGGLIVFGDHTCIVKFINFDFLVGADGTQILQGKPGQSTRFHAYQLQYQGIETTGYNRHFKFLKERDFLTPHFSEQVAIANFLSDMDEEILVLEKRRYKVASLKEAMMQQLLAGRTRLI